MAFLFADSFDHYATADIMQKWTQIVAGNGSTLTIGAFGRRSTNGMRSMVSNSAGNTQVGQMAEIVVAPSGTTAIWGFAFTSSDGGIVMQVTTTVLDTAVSSSSTGSNCFARVLRLGASQIWFRFNSDNTVSAYRGTTLIAGPSTWAMMAGVSYYFEFKVVCNTGTSGSLIMRVDGAEVLNVSGINTANTGVAGWNAIGTPRPTCVSNINHNLNWDIDDLYVLDGSGSTSNDFLGDVRVDAVMPTADGTTSDWTCSTGSSHYALVDEALQNADTDYNLTATLNAKDTLNFPNAPVAGAVIKAVQVNMVARKSDAGNVGVKAATRISGTDYLGTEVMLGSSYRDARQIWDLKPSDSSAWVDTDFNAAEFGYQKTT